MFWTLTGSLSRRFWTRCARLGVGPTEHIAGSACFSGGLLGGRRPERQQDLLHLLPRREDRVDVLVRPATGTLRSTSCCRSTSAGRRTARRRAGRRGRASPAGRRSFICFLTSNVLLNCLSRAAPSGVLVVLPVARRRRVDTLAHVLRGVEVRVEVRPRRDVLVAERPEQRHVLGAHRVGLPGAPVRLELDRCVDPDVTQVARDDLERRDPVGPPADHVDLELHAIALRVVQVAALVREPGVGEGLLRGRPGRTRPSPWRGP